MKKIITFIILLLIFPINILAYSNNIIPGGETIGIEINSKGIMVIGFYKVNGKINKYNLKVGDYITKVNNIEVNTISELTKELEKNTQNNNKITYIRDKKEYITNIKLIKDNNKYKTGLYVKDKISGIGTLSYIDPSTKIFGALGHEVIESTTNNIVEIKTGTIYQSFVTNIIPSKTGFAGSKNAKFNYNVTFGTVFKNNQYGIFGIYNDNDKLNEQTIEVADKNEIKTGKASIITVLDNNKKESFEINITKINETSNTKNIEFEITSKSLINKTGGIIQGMSGSPIMQNNKIIGVVTHVITENPHTGYGLFITTMLKEGEN